MSFKTDPNEFKTCPYDSSHKIAAFKFQTHLIKCKKSHPEIAKNYDVCPFNATHRFLGSERTVHLLNCPDNKLLEEAIRRNKSEQEVRCKVPEITSEHVFNEDADEDWDVEEPQVPIRLNNNGYLTESKTTNHVIKKRSENNDNDDDEYKEVKPKHKYISIGRGLKRN